MAKPPRTNPPGGEPTGYQATLSAIKQNIAGSIGGVGFFLLGGGKGGAVREVTMMMMMMMMMTG